MSRGPDTPTSTSNWRSNTRSRWVGVSNCPGGTLGATFYVPGARGYDGCHTSFDKFLLAENPAACGWAQCDKCQRNLLSAPQAIGFVLHFSEHAHAARSGCRVHSPRGTRYRV